jgi:hypothetical protein
MATRRRRASGFGRDGDTISEAVGAMTARARRGAVGAGARAGLSGRAARRAASDRWGLLSVISDLKIILKENSSKQIARKLENSGKIHGGRK